MSVQRSDSGASVFGEWGTESGFPVFRETLHPDDSRCEWDPMVAPPTKRHWSGFGNRRFQVFADNWGGTAVWDTSQDFRWLTVFEPGTGASILTTGENNGGEYRSWATDRARWPASWVSGSSEARAPVRTWGPTWFTVAGIHDDISIERTVACPEGDAPWLLVRVVLAADRKRTVDVDEEWCLAARSVVGRWGAGRRSADHGAGGSELAEWAADEHGVTIVQPTQVGARHAMRLQSYGPIGDVRVDQRPEGVSVVRLRRRVELAPNTPTELWFCLGRPDEADCPADPAGTWADSLKMLAHRLPRATCEHVPALGREVPWHVALLTGGACTDGVLGDHTLDQGSAYSFHFGFNGAARDPFQHALPLVYCEPDLALSVLRNTCTWAAPHGELPYAIDGAKRPLTDRFKPSDQALWGLWLAAEYAAATGDLAALAEPLGFHPTYDATPVPLAEHLVRQFRHLVDEVGVGAHGHIRIQNADWNDSALVLAPVERSAMEADGESILNSAMAAWVLPRFAGLLRRLDDAGLAGDLAAVADEADQRGEQWRALVAEEWNGSWFRRAYGPGVAVGDDDMWLEVQPWAILCGAADGPRARELLATIQSVLRDDSPLGARLRGPLPIRIPEERFSGEGTAGGIWFSINMTLAWAAARLEPNLAWDELRCMTLNSHTQAYPSIWEGTISGPDAYNTPESARPGHTWAWGNVGMQSFPVNNLHAHAQVVFTYLRLLGVEPTAEGTLRVDGRDGTFSSAVLELDGTGHGSLRSLGPIAVEAPHGTTESHRAGLVSW